jgi:kynurenine formamidase
MVRLSHNLNENTPSYGNRDYFKILENSRISAGDTANSSKWIFSSNHLGTHIDAPKHFYDNGFSICDLDNDFWFSKNVLFLDIPCENSLLINESKFFFDFNKDIEVLLIRTGYEKYRGSEKFWNDNPGLSPDLALFLRTKFPKLRIIGFDFISLTSWKYRSEGKIAHSNFLKSNNKENPICIIEDMSLKKIDFDIENIFISPLFVEDACGSPVTVFANI